MKWTYIKQKTKRLIEHGEEYLSVYLLKIKKDNGISGG